MLARGEGERTSFLCACERGRERKRERREEVREEVRSLPLSREEERRSTEILPTLAASAESNVRCAAVGMEWRSHSAWERGRTGGINREV